MKSTEVKEQLAEFFSTAHEVYREEMMGKERNLQAKEKGKQKGLKKEKHEVDERAK